MYAKFNAEIKDINHKQLVSADCSTQITLKKDNLENDIRDILNFLQTCDENKSQELVVIITNKTIGATP